MKTIQKRSFWVLEVAITILLLAVVLVAAPIWAQTIKVGVLYSATGGYAGFGKPGQRGALLALEQANAAGGIKGQRIETIVYDAESNPDQASRQTKKLIVRDNVLTIIGPEVWRVSTLMHALAVEYKIPIFADLPSPGLLSAEQVSWTFPLTGVPTTTY